MIEPIDIGPLIPPHLLALPHVVKAVIPDIAEAARTEIIRMAHEGLHTTGQDYEDAVQPTKYHFPSGKVPDGDHAVASIVLAGVVPNMVEHGWDGGDMKAILLKSRSARTVKSGPNKGKRYLAVPFQHGTPGASKRNRPAMGSAHAPSPAGSRAMHKTGQMTAEEAAKMGRSIHKAAKKLAPTTGHAQHGTDWGERLAEGHAPLLRSHHKTDIYAGMVRQRKVYRRQAQMTYRTWRIVTAGQPGWPHPGIEAHRFFDRGGEYVGKVAGFLFQQALRGAEKGTR